MNTTSRGNDFENKVYNLLNAELQADNLYISPKTTRIHKKKSYYSKDRGSNIVVDISFETFLPNADEYSLLTLVECKDYNHKVPVDDIEEFHSKVQQIAGSNVKAIFVTTSSLQKGALSFAKSKKIAIIRILPDEQVKWVMYNMTFDMWQKTFSLNSYEFNEAILNQDYVSENKSFYALSGERIYGDMHSLLRSIFNG